ncbi:MAG TPA: chemotaxis protein CheW [Lysobacter sp.]
MNANSAFDEVDAYVDALLGGGMETAVAPIHTVSPGVGEAVLEAAAPFAPADAEVALSPPAAPVDSAPHTRASAPAVATAALQPPMSQPPARTSSAPASNRWLRVTVGSGSYALELLCVQEVVRVTPIVAMRGASRAVLGVMNLRGRIVPVFDLGLWLGTACVEPDERSRIVVVERDDELIGVLVTLVEDVVTLTQNRIEPPLPGSAPGQIVGIARVGAVPTVLLDAGALFG